MLFVANYHKPNFICESEERLDIVGAFVRALTGYRIPKPLKPLKPHKPLKPYNPLVIDLYDLVRTKPANFFGTSVVSEADENYVCTQLRRLLNGKSMKLTCQSPLKKRELDYETLRLFQRIGPGSSGKDLTVLESAVRKRLFQYYQILSSNGTFWYPTYYDEETRIFCLIINVKPVIFKQ